MVVAPVSEGGGGTYVVVAKRDTWSRAARRKKTQQLRVSGIGPHTATEPGIGGTGAGEGGQAALVAHVWVEEECLVVRKSGGESGGQQLVVQWKRGHDAQLFESFASHVAHKIREALVSDSAS